MQSELFLTYNLFSVFPHFANLMIITPVTHSQKIIVIKDVDLMLCHQKEHQYRVGSE